MPKEHFQETMDYHPHKIEADPKKVNAYFYVHNGTTFIWQTGKSRTMARRATLIAKLENQRSKIKIVESAFGG